MYIDHSKLPDPANPQADDVFVTFDGKRTIVMVETPGEETAPTPWISYFLDGDHRSMPRHQIPAMLASAGARPWGRLDRAAATRPPLSREPEVVAERLRLLGPHLRRVREQYGLSMGDLARALGCPGARLSMLELGDPDPVREGAGVREDEGVAALTELLAEAAVNALVGRLLPDPEYDTSGKAQEPNPNKVVVWEALFVMLTTAPARAAMSTIMQARGVEPDRVGTFIVGDRVKYKDMFGKIAELDGELQAARIVTESANISTIVPLAELGLANDNVAVESARDGLALLLARAACREFTGNEEEVIEQSYKLGEVQSELAHVLAGDEAQRLLRLHG